MDIDGHRPRRLRRLSQVWLDGGHPVYFLTICVDGRSPVLNNPVIHGRFLQFAEGSPERYGWTVLCYVLMPDHLHLFGRSMSMPTVTLGHWIKAMKAFVGNRELRWQPSFFDHALRSDESRSKKWEYIRQNPVRAGIVAKPEDWPYWGVDIG
ncbi:MAG: hypothetical protein C0404_10765 [Verrucomicrobia bacterium]|nr:hypothetical protein [Verrucomicrobiota bacterium]